MTGPVPSAASRPSAATSAALRLVGRSDSRECWVIRDFLTRSVVQYEWRPVDDDAQCLQTLGMPLSAARLPVVTFPDGYEMAEPTLGAIADRLGWIQRPRRAEYDVSVYGAGPAGLSAALYAASEGLSVALVERDAVGGQAGSSSLIENYLGFPHGIRGAELAERARQQAVAFGVELLLLREGIRGSFSDHRLRADLADGGTLVAKTNVCATGVEWRRLHLPDESRLLGAGLYYGAGTSEAPMCAGEHVYVVGGANSAGQAAMNLAQHAARVTMLVRGEGLSATMSEYLTSRIAAAPRIDVRVRTRVAALHGDSHLESIEVENTVDGTRESVATRHLFVCIGGLPNTEWASQTEILRDDHGFMVTGPDIAAAELAARKWPLARAPFYLETSVPGSFAAGDVRANSVKRVASAVGEGAMAIAFVHRYLAETF